MTVAEFIKKWNRYCLTPLCRIPPAKLFTHDVTGAPWAGGDITNVHFYKNTDNAVTDNYNDRIITIPVGAFLSRGQTIQIATNDPNVTSVYKDPPKNNPTCFTPQFKVYVS